MPGIVNRSREGGLNMHGPKTLAAALVGLLAVAGAASAGVNQREHRQMQRIRQGVRSGELTGRETRRLLRDQAHIRAEEFRYRHNDGHLSARERADLQRDLNRSSRRIYRQKHDGQDRN
jgi:hypothetical protein